MILRHILKKAGQTPFPDTITLTQKLIRAKSITPNPGATFEILAPLLQSLGFTTHTQSIQNVTNFFAVRELRSNVKKTSAQKPIPHLLFLGHTDVVPADEKTWRHPPFSGHLENNILWGRGAADMKGAIAAFVCATQRYLSNLSTETLAHPCILSILLTSDEEGEALYGTKAMLAHIQKNEKTFFKKTGTFRPTFCLVGEPSSRNTVGDTIKRGRRGSLTGKLTVFGERGHSAYPSHGKNPLPRLLRTLNALLGDIKTTCEGELDAGYKDKDGTQIFEPSKLTLTGIESPFVATNVTPEIATAFFSIRFNPNTTGTALKQKIEKTAQKNAGKHGLDIKINGEPYLTCNTQSLELVRNAVIESLQASGKNITPKFCTSGGTSDGRFVAHLCPTVELGLSSRTIHQVNECVTVDDLNILEAHYVHVLKAFYKKNP